ncbi:hypothetical protein POV13_13230, partial [Enterobacter roggenkampii]
IGPDPRNFNQRVSLGRNDLLIRTFLSAAKFVPEPFVYSGVECIKTTINIAKTLNTSTPGILFAIILINIPKLITNWAAQNAAQLLK